MNVLTTMPLFGPLILWFRMQADKWARAPSVPAIAQRAAGKGTVSLVGAGPGSADLITLRGVDRIRSADVIFYDRLADPALLDHARPGASRVFVGKSPGNHSVPQDEINRLLVQAALAGQRVVRLKCGDPGIFARGAEEAAALDAEGIEWEIVPGVTSAAGAAASARGFLTERGKTERLILATGHLRHDGVQDWASTAQAGTTLACYMGVAQAGPMTAGLLAAGWPADAQVQVISKAQMPDERVFTCELAGLEALCARHRGLNPAILLIRWCLPQEVVAVGVVQAMELA